MNIAQQVIASLPGRESEAVPNEFDTQKILNLSIIREMMEDEHYLQIVEQKGRYTVFTDGSKLCYYSNMFEDIGYSGRIFWTYHKDQITDPKPPKYKTTESRYWIS